MQWKLGRLSHCTNEQANADDGDQHPVGAGQQQSRQFIALGKRFAVIQSAGVGGDQANAQNEAEISDPVNKKGFHVGEDRGRFIEPKSDQQIRHQADRLPTEEKLKHVVAHHQHQHRKCEQRDVGKETVVASVLLHVADGVDVNHERDECHYAHHHGSQPVHQKSNFHFQSTHNHPGVEGFIETCIVLNDLVKGHR